MFLRNNALVALADGTQIPDDVLNVLPDYLRFKSVSIYYYTIYPVNIWEKCSSFAGFLNKFKFAIKTHPKLSLYATIDQNSTSDFYSVKFLFDTLNRNIFQHSWRQIYFNLWYDENAENSTQVISSALQNNRISYCDNISFNFSHVWPPQHLPIKEINDWLFRNNVDDNEDKLVKELELYTRLIVNDDVNALIYILKDVLI